jgi:hypothetical protein
MQIKSSEIRCTGKNPRETRRIWDKAKSREFNIGVEAAVVYHAGHKIPVYVLQLKQKTLEDILCKQDHYLHRLSVRNVHERQTPEKNKTKQTG